MQIGQRNISNLPGKGLDAYQDAILKLITGNYKGNKHISAVYNVYIVFMSGKRPCTEQKRWITYAFLTSSIFNGPVGGRPRTVLSELDPSQHESSSSCSVSLSFFHLLVLFECSLHSNPDVECSEDELLQLLKDHVYHLLPNVAWNICSVWPSKSSEKHSLLIFPEHIMEISG